MSAPTLRSRPHALVIPFPAQGHIGPMMHLSIKLAKEAGFVITFVNTHHHHTLLKELLEPRFREQGLEDIHLAHVVNAGRASGDTTGAQSIPQLCASFYKLTPARIRTLGRIASPGLGLTRLYYLFSIFRPASHLYHI